MTYPESEFLDCVTLARQYDTSRNTIKAVYNELREKGYLIDALHWGKQGKLKIHGKQFRVALMHEYKVERV
ncbi:MAG: hypothetical protein LUE08_07140 [Akkermansiaceae bacterium]|nr:hypothetical protein [Akkermansiaceae bacterium]